MEIELIHIARISGDFEFVFQGSDDQPTRITYHTTELAGFLRQLGFELTSKEAERLTDDRGYEVAELIWTDLILPRLERRLAA